MCDPITATTVLLIGASTAADIHARNTQAKKEEEAAKLAALRDELALEKQRQQIDRSVGLEMFERQRQALRERSRIAVAAGEAGVAGNSPARLIARSLQDAAFDIGVHQANRQAMLEQTMLEQADIRAARDTRINLSRSQQTNPFMAALQIGARAVSAYHSVPKIPYSGR